MRRSPGRRRSYLSFSIEGLNLTNQTEDRWAYQDEPLVTQYSSTGRQIFAGFRLSLCKSIRGAGRPPPRVPAAPGCAIDCSASRRVPQTPEIYGKLCAVRCRQRGRPGTLSEWPSKARDAVHVMTRNDPRKPRRESGNRRCPSSARWSPSFWWCSTAGRSAAGSSTSPTSSRATSTCRAGSSSAASRPSSRTCTPAMGDYAISDRDRRVRARQSARTTSPSR